MRSLTQIALRSNRFTFYWEHNKINIHLYGSRICVHISFGHLALRSSTRIVQYKWSSL
jgi:hypothetical protein